MDKLNYMKTSAQVAKQYLRPSKYLYQPKYEDKILKHGATFTQNWAMMAHMHDLRCWTITYAPGDKGNI